VTQPLKVSQYVETAQISLLDIVLFTSNAFPDTREVTHFLNLLRSGTGQGYIALPPITQTTIALPPITQTTTSKHWSEREKTTPTLTIITQANWSLQHINRHSIQRTSAHWTFAMKPLFCSSSQLASYSFGPMRKLRSQILSSSRTSVAVRPSFVCAWTDDSTRRNIFAGTYCTSAVHNTQTQYVQQWFSNWGPRTKGGPQRVPRGSARGFRKVVIVCTVFNHLRPTCGGV